MFYVFFKYDTETMFFLNCTPVRLLSCHNRRLQGCQIFFAACGQNLIKIVKMTLFSKSYGQNHKVF